MSHTLFLSFYGDTLADNRNVDTADVANFQNASGYNVKSVNFGDDSLEYNPALGEETRTITISLEVQGSTYDNTIALVRKLIRMITATKEFYKSLAGNLPARSDGLNFPGRALTLTWKNQAATNPMYFTVFDGRWETDPNSPINEQSLSRIISGNLILTCEANARGPRRWLENLVNAGDFAKPFFKSSTYNLQASWVFTNTWNVTQGGPFRSYLNSPSGGSATATSNEPTVFPDFGNTLITSQIWYKCTSATFTVTLERYNGSVWSTEATIVSGTSATVGTWTQATIVSSYNSSSYQKLRIVVTKTSGDLSITGVGILPHASTSQPAEYVTAGGTNAFPTFNLYNIQSDAPADFQLYMLSGSASTKIIVAGAMPIVNNPSQSYYQSQFFPVGCLDFSVTSSTTAATTLPWGVLGQALTPSASSTTLAINTSHIPTGATSIDKFNRKYRAFLVYAANDSAAISKVTVNLADETRIFTGSLPQTYTGVSTPIESQYRWYDLGDFFFAKPGDGFAENNTAVGSYLLNATGITVTHANSANLRGAVSGIVLVPAEQMFIADAGSVAFSNSSARRVVFTSYPRSPRVGVGSFAYLNNTGDTHPTFGTAFDLSSISNTAILKGNMRLEPNYHPLDQTNALTASYYSGTQLVVLFFDSRDSTYPNLYTTSAAYTQRLAVSYVPKYRFVGGY